MQLLKRLGRGSGTYTKKSTTVFTYYFSSRLPYLLTRGYTKFLNIFRYSALAMWKEEETKETQCLHLHAYNKLDLILQAVILGLICRSTLCFFSE